MRKLIYILITSTLLIGCSNNTDDHLLIGSYHFSTYGSDIIYVAKDHTYIHKYITTKGKLFECRGKWRYNGREILFHDFNFFGQSGSTSGAGLWISRVEEDGKTIRLIYSSDDDTYFEKE